MDFESKSNEQSLDSLVAADLASGEFGEMKTLLAVQTAEAEKSAKRGLILSAVSGVGMLITLFINPGAAAALGGAMALAQIQTKIAKQKIQKNNNLSISADTAAMVKYDIDRS